MPQHTLLRDLYNSALGEDPRGPSDHWQPEGTNSQHVVQTSNIVTNTHAIEIIQYNQLGMVTPMSAANLRDAGLSVANG